MAYKYFKCTPEIVDDVLYSDCNFDTTHEPDGDYLDQREYLVHDEVNRTFSASHAHVVAGGSLEYLLNYTPDNYFFKQIVKNTSTTFFNTYLYFETDVLTKIASNFTSSDCKSMGDISLLALQLKSEADGALSSFSSESYDTLPLFTHYFGMIKDSLDSYNISEMDAILLALTSLETDLLNIKNESDALSVDLNTLNFDLSLIVPDVETMLDTHVNKFINIDSLNGDSVCFLDGDIVELNGFDGIYKVLSSNILSLGDDSDYIYHLEKQIEGSSNLPRLMVLGSNVKGIIL